MDLKTAIAEREYRFQRYLESKELVDRLAKQTIEEREMEILNRELRPSEVSRLIGVARSTVSRWDTDASTYKEWCKFIKTHINGKYYNRFKRNYKRELT